LGYEYRVCPVQSDNFIGKLHDTVKVVFFCDPICNNLVVIRLEKLSSSSTRLCRDPNCRFKRKQESSRYNDTFVFKPWISKPLILLLDLMLTANILMAIINRYADSGQPCFTPLDNLILSEK
jgi:hypothetical protein